MSAKEKLVELLATYRYPIAVINDVRMRVGDFYLSGNSSDDNDHVLLFAIVLYSFFRLVGDRKSVV